MQTIILAGLVMGLVVLVIGGILHMLDRDHGRESHQQRRSFVRCPACLATLHPDWIVPAEGICGDCYVELDLIAHLPPERTTEPVIAHSTDAAACAGRHPAPGCYVW